MGVKGEFERQPGGFRGYIDWGNENYSVWIRWNEKSNDYGVFTRSSFGRDIKIGKAIAVDAELGSVFEVALEFENQAVTAILECSSKNDDIFVLREI